MAVESISTIKSYLAEGKCPTASELVNVIDTLVSICQNSGGSVSYSHLELVPDLDVYTEAPVGKIVKYNGQTNNKYTRGWDYEKVVNTSGSPMTINSGEVYMHDIHPMYMTTPDNQMYNANDDIPESVQDDINTFLLQKGGGVFKKTGTMTVSVTTGAGSVSGAFNFIDLEHTPPEVGDTIIFTDGYVGWFGTITDINGNYITYERENTNTGKVYTSTIDYSRKTTRTIEVYTNAAGCRMIHYHSNIWSLPSSGSNNVTGGILIFQDDNCNLCMSNASGSAIVTVADESITIEPVGIASWQPIIFPSAPISSGN